MYDLVEDERLLNNRCCPCCGAPCRISYWRLSSSFWSYAVRCTRYGDLGCLHTSYKRTKADAITNWDHLVDKHNATTEGQT